MIEALRKGDRVMVRNATLSGNPFDEGMATVMRPLEKPDMDGTQRAYVHFDEDGEPMECVVERLINIERDRE